MGIAITLTPPSTSLSSILSIDRVRYKSLKLRAYLDILLHGLNLIYLIEDKELFFLMCNQHGFSSGLVCHKDLF